MEYTRGHPVFAPLAGRWRAMQQLVRLTIALRGPHLTQWAADWVPRGPGRPRGHTRACAEPPDAAGW